MKITLNKQKKQILLIVLSAILGLGMILGGLFALLGGKGNAPDFTVLNERGQSVQLSDYRGKPVVVNFWATWCAPCQSELPAFESAYEEYKKDIQFMMVNLTTKEDSLGSLSDIKDFVNERGYDFPLYFDTKGEASKAYDGLTSIPVTLFIDKKGDLVYQHVGAMSEMRLIQFIEKYLR